MALAPAATRTSALTVSATNSSNILNSLVQASQTAAQMTQQVEIDQINGAINKQLQQKIAALPDTADNAMLQVTQSQVSQLNSTLSTINTAASQFTANGNLVSTIQNLLAGLQTDAANGDSTNFDNTLATIATSVGNLQVVNPTAPFQPDQILPLKATGIGVKNSASYDLSTPAGQAAAKADIGNAQSLVNQIFSVITSNQLVATDVTSALSSQIDSLNQTMQQTQSNDQLQVAAQTSQLTQLAQDQEHLIQLALGNTSQLSTALTTMTAQTAQPSSPLEALYDAVGATASSITPQQTSDAVLSILA